MSILQCKHDSYVDTEYECIGPIPEHWSVTRLKFLTTCLDGQRIPLNATERGELQGDIPYWGSNNVVDHVSEYLFDEELILLGEDGAPFFEANRDVAFAVSGKIWPNNHVHVLRPNGRLADTKFLAFSLNCVPYHLHVTGSTRDKLNQSDMNEILVRRPPLIEQKQIASFLDYETGKIDALIAMQQQLIALLGEKRQAVISHAVTKGLNPDAPMRDSGVQWLGQVPEHWKLRRLKHAVADDGIQMGPFGTSLINVLREPAAYCVFGQANTISGDFKEVSRWLPESAYRGLQHYRLFPGDLVLTRKGSLGNCRVVPDEVPAGIMDSDTIRVRTRSDLSSVFLAKLMHDALYIEVQIDLNRRGAILPGLNTSVVGNLLLAVPPPQEQFDILADLADKTGRLDQIADNLFDQLSLLRERRTALISAAVTGKIDVRGWKPPSSAAKSETEMEVA